VNAFYIFALFAFVRGGYEERLIERILDEKDVMVAQAREARASLREMGVWAECDRSQWGPQTKRAGGRKALRLVIDAEIKRRYG
jgi:hypothetical protein